MVACFFCEHRAQLSNILMLNLISYLTKDRENLFDVSKRLHSGKEFINKDKSSQEGFCFWHMPKIVLLEK